MSDIPTPIADAIRALQSVTNRDEIVTIIEAIERNAYVTRTSRKVRDSNSKGAIRAKRWREKQAALRNAKPQTPPLSTKIKIKKERGRSASVTLRDDFKPDPKSASSAGLTIVEADREFQKFKNYAAIHDRRCAGDRGWNAAWANWCIKAAEFMGRAPPTNGKVIEMSGFYASFASPQLAAWESYERVNGKKYPRDKAGGWRFPTEWPPGHQAVG